MYNRPYDQLLGFKARQDVPAMNVSSTISEGFQRYDFSFTDINRITKNGYGDGRGGNALIAGIFAFYQRTFPQADLKVGDTEGVASTGFNDVQKLLSNPNPQQSESEFKNNIITFLLAGGECFVLLGANNSQNIVQMWCYHGGLMQPRYDDNGYLSHYEYFNPSRPGSRKRYEKEYVIHLKWSAMNAHNANKATSPIVQAFREIETDNERGRAVYSFLKNDCNPLSLVRLTAGGPMVMNPETMKLWQEQYKIATSGDSKGLPMLSTGIDGIDRLGTGFEHLDTEAICKEIESRLGTIFGISPILLDWCIGTKSSTYENVREADKRFNTRTLAPLLDQIANKLTDGLKKHFLGEFKVFFDRSRMESFRELQIEKEKHEVFLMQSGVKTVGEVREKLNLPVLPEQQTKNELRTTVGGAQTLASLLKDYYADLIDRASCVAMCEITFGYTSDEANKIFIEKKSKTTIDPQGKIVPEGSPA